MVEFYLVYNKNRIVLLLSDDSDPFMKREVPEGRRFKITWLLINLNTCEYMYVEIIVISVFLMFSKSTAWDIDVAIDDY